MKTHEWLIRANIQRMIQGLEKLSTTPEMNTQDRAAELFEVAFVAMILGNILNQGMSPAEALSHVKGLTGNVLGDEEFESLLARIMNAYSVVPARPWLKG